MFRILSLSLISFQVHFVFLCFPFRTFHVPWICLYVPFSFHFPILCFLHIIFFVFLISLISVISSLLSFFLYFPFFLSFHRHSMFLNLSLSSFYFSSFSVNFLYVPLIFLYSPFISSYSFHFPCYCSICIICPFMFLFVFLFSSSIIPKILSIFLTCSFHFPFISLAVPFSHLFHLFCFLFILLVEEYESINK